MLVLFRLHAKDFSLLLQQKVSAFQPNKSDISVLGLYYNNASRERVTLNLGTGWGNYCPPAPLVTSPLPGRSTCHQGFCVCQDRCKLLL